MARYEILIGMHVTDEAAYARYREGMTPLLEACGGFFRYDFAVSRVLKGENERINRVFVISFPDEGTKDAFFDNEEYLRVREAHFEGAVESTEIIAGFEMS